MSSKYEDKRNEIQKKLEEELRKIDAEEKLHKKKTVAPLVSKFSNLIAEEVEKFGNDNFESAEAYKFNKTELRAKLRQFVADELTSK
jgi:hypothetical protein